LPYLKDISTYLFSKSAPLRTAAALTASAFAMDFNARAQQTTFDNVTLAWDRDCATCPSYEIHARRTFDLINNAPIINEPALKMVGRPYETADLKDNSGTVYLTPGYTYELLVANVAPNQSRTDFANPVTATILPAASEIKGAVTDKNTYILTEAVNFLHGGNQDDLILHKNTSGAVRGWTYDGDDIVKGGGTGTSQTYTLGRGRDTYIMNGGRNVLYVGEGSDTIRFGKNAYLAGAVTGIWDFNLSEDIISAEYAENLPPAFDYNPNLYFEFQPNPQTPAHMDLMYNPWGNGFTATTPPSNYKAIITLYNASTAIQNFPLQNGQTIIDHMTARGNLTLTPNHAEIIFSRMNYADNTIRTLAEPLNNKITPMVFTWAPGFKPLAQQVDNIDDFIYLEKLGANDVKIYYNPYGDGFTTQNSRHIATAINSWDKFEKLRLGTYETTPQALIRTGAIKIPKLFNEYVFTQADYDSSAPYEIASYGTTFDLYRGDRLVITSATTPFNEASNINNFVKFVYNPTNNANYVRFAPLGNYGNSTTWKNLFRIDNAAAMNILAQPGETVVEILKENNALYILPEPPPDPELNP
jgi:hypothetical protein